jgi:hypothetical protein
MQDLWNSIKRSNHWVIGIKEEQKIQAKGMENILNKIIAEISQILIKGDHLGTGNYLDSKQTRPEKNFPMSYYC